LEALGFTRKLKEKGGGNAEVAEDPWGGGDRRRGRRKPREDKKGNYDHVPGKGGRDGQRLGGGDNEQETRFWKDLAEPKRSVA